MGFRVIYPRHGDLGHENWPKNAAEQQHSVDPASDGVIFTLGLRRNGRVSLNDVYENRSATDAGVRFDEK